MKLAVEIGAMDLCGKRGNRCHTFERFPAIARACDKLPLDTMIDAEVVVVDENGRYAFNALQHKGP